MIHCTFYQFIFIYVGEATGNILVSVISYGIVAIYSHSLFRLSFLSLKKIAACQVTEKPHGPLHWKKTWRKGLNSDFYTLHSIHISMSALL